MDENKKKLEKTSERVDTLIMISTELIKEVNELEERLEKLEKSNSKGHNHIGKLTERVLLLESEYQYHDLKIREHDNTLYIKPEHLKPKNVNNDVSELFKHIRVVIK